MNYIVRITITRTFAIALVLVLTATGLWAAGAEEEPAAAADKEMVLDPSTGKMVEAPQYGGTITYAKKTEPENVDVWFHHGGRQMITGVLEKLGTVNWGVDRDDYNFVGQVQPEFATTGQLAESWETPDDKTIIVKVRQGVHWHNKAPMNGRELTANDIEYNFHRLMGLGKFAEAGPTNITQVLRTVSFESITATDKYTVVFKLTKPHLGALMGILEDWIAFMYPPEVIEQYGDANDWRNLVGTGPFMLTDWVEGSSVTWDKNPDYWGYDEKYPQNRLPYVDQIRDLTMPEAATRLAGLRSGKLDSLYRGTAIQSVDAAESLERTNPEIELWTNVIYSAFSTGLNVNKPPFDDIRVRKAMQMALNLEEINSVFFKGYGHPIPHGQVGDTVPGYFIPFEEWHAELKKVYDYDPEGAEALLDEAGYPRGADGIRFKTELMHNVHKDLNFYELLVSYWNKIGIDVEIDFPPIATWVSRRTSRDFEMIEHEMAYGSLADPYNPVNRFTNVPWNSAAVEDPVYDAMFEAAGAATTIEEQQRLVKELDMYAIERHWTVWSPMNPQFDAFWPWIKGYNGEFKLGYTPTHFFLARVWIDQELKEAMGY